MPESEGPILTLNPEQWKEDCELWRGQVLTGRYSHWCMEWDGLPIDETCDEWPCNCAWATEVTSA